MVMLLDRMLAKEPVVMVTDWPVLAAPPGPEVPAEPEPLFEVSTPSRAACAGSSDGMGNGVPVNSPSENVAGSQDVTGGKVEGSE